MQEKIIKTEYGNFNLKEVIELLENLDTCARNGIAMLVPNESLMQWFLEKQWIKVRKAIRHKKDWNGYCGTQLLVDNFDDIIENLKQSAN